MRFILIACALTISIHATSTLAEEKDQGYQQPVVEQQLELTAGEKDEANEILKRLVADYRIDPMAISGEFGIRLADQFWTVKIDRKESASKRGRLTDHEFGPHEVSLKNNKPENPTFVYIIASMDVLRLISEGKVNAGTAAMQSFGSDQVGVETGAVNGYEMTSGGEAQLYHHLSHFFTTGVPEITFFGPENSLETHGAQMTALHFMKGFRIGYFTMQPQQTVNADIRLQKGQMPNLFIITRGRGKAYLGDSEIELKPGMSVYVAPFVRHEFTAIGDEPMEGVVVLYGDNSDFAFGTSYPAYLEDLYDFHAEYPFRKD
ncbi:MAG: cupin domain-containing protein [Xanthomonadales bacterium]|nr:cupin domain-containing protein [Xanthomonadales bacterium]NIX12589.1 cupin domain-containing protein [Xanthomonadales bacterium]